MYIDYNSMTDEEVMVKTATSFYICTLFTMRIM